jgi:hypothetical protein
MAYRFIGEPLEIARMAIIKKNSIRIKQLLPCFTVSRLQRINGRFLQLDELTFLSSVLPR